MNLLWIAPDHVHLYVETDGERSVEWIVKEVKQISQQTIFSQSMEDLDANFSSLFLKRREYQKAG